MKTLKFRAWGINIKEYLKDADGNANCVYILGDLLKQGNWIFEQYTGLKDKNGKEIYEGDIVKVYAWTNLTRGLEYRHTTKVFWQEKYAQFNTTYNDALSNEITQDYFEVIGNIHENPELLEDN